LQKKKDRQNYFICQVQLHQDLSNLRSTPQFQEMTCDGSGQIGFILEKLNSRGAVKYQKEASPLGKPRCALREPAKNDTIQQVIKMRFCDPNRPADDSGEFLELTYKKIDDLGITLKTKSLYNLEKESQKDPDEDRRQSLK